MDKDMRQRCILCEQTKPYKWYQSATTFICADCRAAALGRAAVLDEANNEIARLRAALAAKDAENKMLRRILARAIAEEACGADSEIHTVATECTEGKCWHAQARAALLRAEQAGKKEINEDDEQRKDAEIERLRTDVELLLWNLAGCSTIATMERPTDFSKEMARPALHDVNDLAKKYQDSRAEIERLRTALRAARPSLTEKGWRVVQDALGEGGKKEEQER